MVKDQSSRRYLQGTVYSRLDGVHGSCKSSINKLSSLLHIGRTMCMEQSVKDIADSLMLSLIDSIGFGVLDGSWNISGLVLL